MARGRGTLRSTRRAPGRPLARALAVGAVLTLPLAGCLGSPATTLAPRSDFAATSHRLFLLVLAVDSVIFVVVAALLVTAIVRFRERDPAAIPPQVRGKPRLELTWTVLPALVLTVIAFPTVRAIFEGQAAPPPDALRIRVVGHQWWWEFQYSDLGVATATDLHLPAGRRVALELTAADVIHSFWVPGLGGKRDAIPGQVNRILLTPAAPGVYPGQCAEFCGVSHAHMRHAAVVQTLAEFQAWVDRQRAPAAEPAEGTAAARGKALFTQLPCVGCHTIRGVSGGTLGPDLTHFGSRRTIAGGMLPNTPQHLARWLRNPAAVKPGALMPDLRLAEDQIQALVAYLGSLR